MIRTGEPENSQDTPERALIVAMFERAILDYFFNTTSDRNMREVDRRTAEVWLLEDYEGSGSYWAEYADLEGLLENTRRLMMEEKQDANFFDSLSNGNIRQSIKYELQRPTKRRIFNS